MALGRITKEQMGNLNNCLAFLLTLRGRWIMGR